jgi:hypothetical protein
MPGIYINDGGGSTSALSGAIANLAGAFSPEAQARARLLQLQSESADWDAREKSFQVPLEESAARGAPSLLSGFNANPPGGSSTGATVGNVTDGGSSVASTVANMTQQGPNASMNQGGSSASGAGVAASNAPRPAGAPIGGPSQRGSMDTRGMSPFAIYVANEVAHGRMSPDALTSAVNLGQSQTMGPSNTFAARSQPIHVGQTETVFRDPALGDKPGNVLTSQVDPYQTGTTTALAASDPAEAAATFKRGLAARADQQKLNALEEYYDKVWNASEDQWGSEAGAIAASLATSKASDILGLDLTKFSSKGDALQAIKGLMQGLTGTDRPTMGDPELRGSLPAILQQLPNPDLAPDAFHFMAEQFKQGLQRQVLDGDTAQAYLDSPRRNSDAIRYRQGLVDNRQNAQPPQPANPPTPSPAPAPNPQPAPGPKQNAGGADPQAVLADAKRTLGQVPQGFTREQWRQRIIEHAKQRYGVDLGSMGF